YYKKHALADSPAQRDASPTVVLLPGVGMFTFGKNKTEARLTGEFYVNAIGVMGGAGALGGGRKCDDIPQAGPAAAADQFSTFDNRKRESVKAALAATVEQFGGVDIIINTAAIFPSSPDGIITDEQWALTLEVNVTGNHILADEVHRILKAQGLDATMVLTSS